MRSSRLYIALGTIVLSITGLLITKANKKYASFTCAHLVGLSPSNITFNSPTAQLTSIYGSNNATLYIATFLGGVTNLHTAVTCTAGSVQLYLKP